MNDKIRELAVEAGLGRERWNTTPQFEAFLQKFGELIVLESAEEVMTYRLHNNPTREMVPFIVEDIKLHFGVEENRGWVCPKCGIDRIKAVCPKGHAAAATGDCPMIGAAQ